MSAAHPVYMELVDFIASGTTPESIIRFRPSEATKERVSGLIERQNDGLLSEEESSELDDFLQLEHILIMAKAQARQRLQLA
jgi:hypothetical protein